MPSSVEIRPFRRSDREQLTALVNAHAAAVVPGVSVSVNAVLSRLEGEPGEFVVDPWVRERVALVAEQRGRVVAAAHLLRYGSDESVGQSYRGLAEIRWFVFWPPAPYWPDSEEAAEALLAAAVAQLDRWGARRQSLDGALPAPGVYGLPEQWPHVRALCRRAGFEHDEDAGRTEIVCLARVEELRGAAGAPVDGLALRRTLGVNGVRLAALAGGEEIGHVEVESLEDVARFGRRGGLADVGNLEVAEPHRRRGVGRRLVAAAADWLDLAGADRLLAYAWLEQEEAVAFLRAVGFRELTRTERGWRRDPARTWPPETRPGA